MFIKTGQEKVFPEGAQKEAMGYRKQMETAREPQEFFEAAISASVLRVRDKTMEGDDPLSLKATPLEIEDLNRTTIIIDGAKYPHEAPAPMKSAESKSAEKESTESEHVEDKLAESKPVEVERTSFQKSVAALAKFTERNQEAFSILNGFISQNLKATLFGLVPETESGEPIDGNLKKIQQQQVNSGFKVTQGGAEKQANASAVLVEFKSLDGGNCEATLTAPIDFYPNSNDVCAKFPLGRREVLRMNQVSKFVINGELAGKGVLKLESAEINYEYSGQFNFKGAPKSNTESKT
jgi:hypothetical protein